MSFQRYAKYKDSGVEWLGQVPEHWPVAPLKRGYEVTLGKMLQPEADAPDDTLLSYLRAANIHWAGTDTNDVKQMWFSARDRAQLLLKRGDLLVSEGGDVGRSCIWAAELEECHFQNSINRVRARSGQSNRYLYYWIWTIKAKGYIDVLCNKSTIAHFTAEKVAAVPVPFPPPPEQTAIAAFLDRETAKIDALVSEQQRLIELLKEKRQAVISHAVTKGLPAETAPKAGLNPNAPMKPSGIEWIGDVPAHWGVSRLGNYATVENGTTPRRDCAEYWYGGDIPWLSSGEVNQYRVTEAQEYITASALKECSLRLLPKGTIVVGMIGQGKTRGLCASLEIEATINQNLAAIIPGAQLSPDYLLHIFESAYEYLREFGRGGNQAALNCEILSALKIPLPPLSEQAQIAQDLRQLLARIGSLLSESERAIDLLQERRTALVSAAVTGQIDVRDLPSAVALPKEDPSAIALAKEDPSAIALAKEDGVPASSRETRPAPSESAEPAALGK